MGMNKLGTYSNSCQFVSCWSPYVRVNSLKYSPYLIFYFFSNPLLFKSTLKYLVYWQVIWVELRHLQGRFISIWALLFYYYISNNLPCEKTVIQISQSKLSFSNYVFWQNKIFLCKTVKVKKCLLLLPDFFSFFLFIFYFFNVFILCFTISSNF